MFFFPIGCEHMSPWLKAFLLFFLLRTIGTKWFGLKKWTYRYGNELNKICRSSAGADEGTQGAISWLNNNLYLSSPQSG